MTWPWVVLYLVAAIAANLAVARFGPAAAPVVAFLFVGFDLVARDVVHERWEGRSLVRRMGAMILAGSVLTYVVNPAARRVAVASAAAFLVAATVDAVGYHLLRRRSRLVRINGSNVTSALGDSVVFQGLAFGEWVGLVVLAQWAAKVGGGFLWSLVVARARARPRPARLRLARGGRGE